MNENKLQKEENLIANKSCCIIEENKEKELDNETNKSEDSEKTVKYSEIKSKVA